jgi:hypothetical protein
MDALVSDQGDSPAKTIRLGGIDRTHRKHAACMRNARLPFLSCIHGRFIDSLISVGNRSFTEQEIERFGAPNHHHRQFDVDASNCPVWLHRLCLSKDGWHYPAMMLTRSREGFHPGILDAPECQSGRAASAVAWGERSHHRIKPTTD